MIRFPAWSLLLLAVIAARADGQARPFGEQSHAFRFALKANGLNALDSVGSLLESPRVHLLILLGEIEALDEQLQDTGLRQFLEMGGAVLLATDRRLSRDLARQTEVRIGSRIVHAKPDDCYRGMIDCPMVHEYRWETFAVTLRNPLFASLPENPHIAANRPSVIEAWGKPWLAATIRTPGYEFSVRDARNRIQRIRDTAPIAVVRSFDNGGRLAVIADHSIFSNDMMIQSDTDNFPFALGAIRWLTDDGKRTGVLLIEDGRIQSDLNVPIKLPPLPRMPTANELLPFANRLVDALQNDNTIKQKISQAIPYREMMRGTLILLTLGLLGWGVFRFLNARQRGDARPKPAKTALATAGLDELRPQAVLITGQFGEAARELAHLAFAELGAPPAMGADPPAVAVRGTWWERLRWRRQVNALWSLCDDPGGVSSRRLQRILADLHALREAARAGVVQLRPAR